MKKIIFIIVFLFSPALVLADSRCPDYCSDGTFYSGRNYNTRTGECDSPTDREKCDYGCDGRDKCLEGRDCPEKCEDDTYYYRGSFSASKRDCSYSEKKCEYGCDDDECADAPVLKITESCLDKCVGGIFYTEGQYDIQNKHCDYKSENECNSGLCDRYGKKCIKREEVPSCDSYCKDGIKYLNGKPTVQGTCVFEKESCHGGCSLDNQSECSLVFKIGPAYFTDPKDSKVKPIPEAKVTLFWMYPNTKKFEANNLIKVDLPERATDDKGNISVSQEELYKFFDNPNAKLTVVVNLEDFKKRFVIKDASNGDSVPLLSRTIYINKPETYSIDFNFDVTDIDRANAKIYYHNWEAVNFAEKGLGVPINFYPPEEIHINKNGICGGACHLLANEGDQTDGGIYYNVEHSALIRPDSPENLEWHEFCHHIMVDEFNFIPPWPKPCGCNGYCNHCGFPNPTSTDSWIEGWAEFCSLMIKDFYGYANPNMYVTINLEGNFLVKKKEEFAVAAALWDLYDDPAGDKIKLSRETIWGALKEKYDFAKTGKKGIVSNFFEVYQAIKGVSTLGANVSNDPNGDGATVWDDVLIDSNCFGDVNNNFKWDKGEIVGQTYNKKTKQLRPDHPWLPGAYVKVNLRDGSGNAITDTQVLVKIKFNSPPKNGENWDYEYEYPLENGQVYLEPMQDFDSTIEIQALTGDKKINVAKINSRDYWQKYDEKKEFVASYDLKVDDLQNAPESQLFLSEAIAKASENKILVESSKLANSVYKIDGTKNVKILWLVPVKMKVQMEIDAQTGNILKTEKPWWGILCF